MNVVWVCFTQTGCRWSQLLSTNANTKSSSLTAIHNVTSTTDPCQLSLLSPPSSAACIPRTSVSCRRQFRFVFCVDNYGRRAMYCIFHAFLRTPVLSLNCVVFVWRCCQCTRKRQWALYVPNSPHLRSSQTRQPFVFICRKFLKEITGSGYENCLHNFGLYWRPCFMYFTL